MSLADLLAGNRPAILSRWCDAVTTSYPKDTASFIRRTNDQFANPIGHTMRSSFDQILGSLINESSPEAAAAPLDSVIRVRAVQDFSPSQAVSFIFLLKSVVRDVVAEQKSAASEDDLALLDDRVDVLALCAFDIFMNCREKLYDIRANELRNMTFRLVQRAQKMGDDTSSTVDPSAADVNLKQE